MAYQFFYKKLPANELENVLTGESAFSHMSLLRDSKKFSELDEFYERLPAALKFNLGIMSMWCSIPRLTGNWVEALIRSDLMMAHWPKDSQSFMHKLYAIGGLTDYNLSKQYFIRIVEIIGENPDLLNAAAELAMAANDVEQVIELCDRLRRFGERHFGAGLRHAYAISLHRMGRIGEALQIVSSGLEIFPEHPLLLGDAHAWNAPIPDNKPKLILYDDAKRRKSYSTIRNEADIFSIVGCSPKELVLQFDTLGENCEFGFIQRAVGAEPISLMRFAGMRWEEMTLALNSSFFGIDEIDNLMTEIGDQPVWDIRDRRYNIAYHTFLSVSENPRDRVLTAQARRLRWLADKLMRDIFDGEKIFIAWRSRPDATNDISSLYHAVRRIGNATLLWVVPEPGIPGVEEIAPRLLRGRVRWLHRPTEMNRDAPNWDVDGWLAMLANALLLERRS